ncbi:putative NTE family protein YlbK [Clostridia bacterium]|nr:putative NTE family protein YlbK [Clostridia bacterium]
MEKIKIGLALGAGGARGMCHVGVLQALEENGITPDLITGSSMGAVIGGAYASGLDVEHIMALTRSVNNHLIRDLHIRLKQLGIFKGRRVEKLFNRHIGDATFEDCKIPFACTAVDVESGKLKLFTEGHLWKAIRASMSIPVAFQPVEIDGRLYMDGGVLCRIPIAQIREMGADVVIAVDALGSLSSGKRPNGILDMALRFYDILDWAYSRHRLQGADIMLTPSVERSIMDFQKVRPVIDAGYQCTMDQMTEIKKAVAAAEEKKLSEAAAKAAEDATNSAQL